MRTEAGKDPDKTLAACVWLWVRDAALCAAPEAVGRRFDADLRIGQIDLSSAVRCKLGDMRLTSRDVSVLQRFTHDGELALTALVVRRLEQEATNVGTAEILAAERRVIAARFGGSRRAYLAALTRASAGVPIARGILGDELRRRELEDRFRVPRPGPRIVRRYLTTQAAVLARRVVVSPAPSWLPEGIGFALASSAPASLYAVPTGRTARLATIEGSLIVRAVDNTTVLEALPLNLVGPAIVRELEYEQRSEAHDDWALRRQHGAESRLVCQKDRLPEIGVVARSSLAPFLALHETAAAASG